MPIFKSKEEYELYKKIDKSSEGLSKAMECRYCKKDVTSYTEQPNITVTFNNEDDDRIYNNIEYKGKTLRVCACKGIDPLNRSDAKKGWVVYNNYGQVCGVNPYTNDMMQRGADISEGYRYKLHRIWESTKNKILFIMINPSTGDAAEDDKTIKILLKITKKWDYGGFYVGNLYPHISAKPSELKNTYIPDEIHMKNRKSIEEMASECSLIVYAWGTKGPDERQKEPEWLRNIIGNRDVHCIYTPNPKNGVPKHPNQWGPTAEPIPNIPIPFAR